MSDGHSFNGLNEQNLKTATAVHSILTWFLLFLLFILRIKTEKLYI